MLSTTRERRAFMRMVVNAPVTLIRGQERFLATCLDLSANGMAIEVEGNYTFTDHEELKINLATNSNALPPFETVGRVIRIEKKGQLIHLGVEFVTAS